MTFNKVAPLQGASGVGLAAVQLSKALWRGVSVIVTAGSDEKLSICKKHGADVGINYKTQDFSAEVLVATDNKGMYAYMCLIHRYAHTYTHTHRC